MQSETKTCKNCAKSFTIEPDDFGFYEKMQVPPPTRCPECRFIRRLTFRNDRALYKRKCDKCGADKIFMYPADAPFPVYCWQCWLSDSWDPKSYAREYEADKPFFQQLLELRNAVPRCGVVKHGFSINSEYTNRVTDMKNCYLIFETTHAEDCRYGAGYDSSKDCTDCFNAQKSERCYECIDVYQCYNLKYSQECIECRDSSYLINCRNCTDCFGCVNLRNKSFCIYNQQYTKDEYKAAIKIFNQDTFDELRKKSITPWAQMHKSTNATGNWIENSKNVFHSFNTIEVEDARYCYRVLWGKDLMDYGPWSNHSERMYESINCGIQCANVKFSNECWNQLIDSEYCMNCHSSKNLFGCNGMRNAQYCILNKQYFREEYELLCSKIKAQMTKADEYGEFFPMELSPHAYNETLAQEFFPLTKEQALTKGYRWRDMEEKKYEIKDDVVACEHNRRCSQQCTTAFRMIPDELAFYEHNNIPHPKLCPNCRHYERIQKRTPLKLWSRTCAKCSAPIETSYSPDRPEIVYCDFLRQMCYN